MEIKPTYVTFEQAKFLKEKGFNIKVISFFDNDRLSEPKDRKVDGFTIYNPINWNVVKPHYYSRPEQHIVVEWLRVKHGIWIKVDHFMTTENTIDWDFEIDRVDTDVDERGNYIPLKSFDPSRSFVSPQEAYSAAFDYVLTNLLK